MRSSTRGLAHDALELAELQVRLFAADGQQCVQKSFPPLLVMMVGFVLALSGFPFALLSAMYALIEYAEFAAWLAALCSAAIGIVVGGLLAAVGFVWLRPQLSILVHSFSDLKDNLDWLKTALRRDATDSKE